MGLDFAILNDQNYPLKYVGIGVADHQEMIEYIRKNDTLKLLSQMEDYYSDVDFEPSENIALVEELEELINSSMSEGVKNKLKLMIDLAREAIKKKLRISLIAD